MIAVLPFENLSGDPAQDYFSEGFTDELISLLGRIDPSRLGVIARTSTLGYRGGAKSASTIGRELGAAHLVEGSVRRSGNRVRVTAQLIRVADQSDVWSEVYDAELRDLLAVQHEVASAIAKRIVATLGTSNGTAARAVDPEVFDLYLRGRYLWNRRRSDQTEQAIAIFGEAVGRDPAFAPAYAGLADSLLVGSPRAALAAAEKALALDNRLAEAHAAKASALMHLLLWEPAEQAFHAAIDLDPSYVPARYFFSEYLFARGRCHEARDQALTGLALDPLSAIANHVAGVTLYYCRAYDEALPYLRRALELDPAHHCSHYRIGLVLEQRGRYDDALAEFTTANVPIVGAYTYAMSGRPAEARRLIAATLATGRLDENAYQIGLAYAALGDQPEAMRWLTRVLRNHLFQAPYLLADPRADRLRSTPGFQALLREAGLAEPR
jgi:TolB-like protein